MGASAEWDYRIRKYIQFAYFGNYQDQDEPRDWSSARLVTSPNRQGPYKRLRERPSIQLAPARYQVILEAIAHCII